MTTPPWGANPEDPNQQPPPPPPGSGQAPYQPYGGAANPYGGSAPYQPPRPTNGLAIAAMVVSIVSLLLCCGSTGIVGAIMGHVARKQARQRNEQGEGMALAGIIVGWIAFALFVIGAIFYVVFIVWAIGEAENADCPTTDPDYPFC